MSGSRFPLALLAAGAVAATVTSACSQNAFEPIAVTRDATVVASCQKVADLEAVPGRFDDTDAATQLQREAKEKGANTLLISDAEGRTGVAYRCSMPAVTGSGGTR
jgi:hypothetical protein